MLITRSMIRYRQSDGGAGTSGSGGSGNPGQQGGQGGGAGAGEGGSGGGSNTGQQGGQGGGGDDPATRALRAERDRADAAERELSEAKKRLKEIDDRDLTELQKAQKRADDAEKAANERADKVRELVGKDAVLTEAIAANAKRPAAIYQIVKGSLQFDEKTGEVTNAKAVIEQAKKDVPELFGISTGNAGQGAGGAGGAGTDMNALIRNAAGRGSN